MSNPANRLASFRSYSYYHVLVMCDCSQTADQLANSTSLGVWEHATPNTQISDSRPGSESLGPYAPKRIPGGGKYIVLINGSTDAAFVISQARWLSATGANAVPGDRSTSIAVEGSLHISEPKGIAFLDQVVKCCVALGVDSSQVVYVLKTFFIGFRDDDTTVDNQGNRTDYITDVPPINMIVYDVTGSFTEAGGSYEMLFVAAGHGGARMPQYSKAVNAMNITAGASLALTLKRLEAQVNENYLKYYDCVYQQIKSTQGVDSASLLSSLRKVRYVIEVAPDYQDTSTGQVKYTVTNQAQQYKNSAGCDDKAQITFPAHTSIEGAISTIMMMSPEVQADMSKGDPVSKVKYEYKIHTAIVTHPVAGGDESNLECIVYYRVERFMTPKTIAFDPSFRVLTQDDDALKKDPAYDSIRRNIIEYDYIYTGKNIDILEFDMKINMGLAYLQTATLANTFKSQLERVPNRQMQPSVQDMNVTTVRFGGAPVQSFVFFGSQIRTPNLINTQNAGNAIQSAYTLNKHSSLEVAEATMRIIGNEQLLGTINRTTSPEYVVMSATRNTTATSSPAQSNFQDWSHAPAFVKVNIKMPRENDDFSLFTGQSSTGDPRSSSNVTDYARDFWFDGYYYVHQIEHVFDDGEFTQQLQMIGIPKKSSFEITQANASREVDLTTAVGSCYDNQIGCGASTAASNDGQSAVAVPHVPPSGSTYPTNRPDATSYNGRKTELSDIIGWDQAAPDVKAAIIDAANRYNVNVVTAALIASHESTFNATAENPKSSAVGLFQIIESTWINLVRQGQIIGVTIPDLNLRLNPVYNSYGGVSLLRTNTKVLGSSAVGDLYLAHFLGIDPALRVINSDIVTGGQGLLIGILGKGTMTRVIAANPTVVNINTTVGELRTWAALVMAKRLKNPILVAQQSAQQPYSKTPSGQTVASASPETSGRTADKSISAVQNCAEQQNKIDAKPCGPTYNDVKQDQPKKQAVVVLAPAQAAGAPSTGR